VKIAFLYVLILTLFIRANYNDEFENYLKKERNSFNQYKKAIDEEWKQFKTSKITSPYQIKKPKYLPKLKEIKPNRLNKYSSKKVKDINLKPHMQAPIKKTMQKIDTIFSKSKAISFLSHKVNIPYDESMTKKIIGLNNKSISKYYKSLEHSKYKQTINFLKKYKKYRNLSDWEILVLIKGFTSKIHSSNNNQILLSWFILLKLDYDMKVAISNKRLILLAKVNHNLYSTPFIKINNKKYYVLFGAKANNLTTYKGNMGSYNALSFKNKLATIGINDYKSKILNFKYQNKTYKIKTLYSPSILRLYKDMPQSDYKIYFDSVMDKRIAFSLLNSMSKIIKNKSEVEAINILLRFTQKAFKYKTDANNFGYEKVLFPEETIYYSYSDCEDRSLMFSYLVRKLLKKKVILLKYSDHLATAIKMPNIIKGDSIRYKQENYLIADPTYINANLAMSMPKYKNARFKVIE